MQDFEPYFCTTEGCTAPFDIPNSFDGLLGHLQGHLPMKSYVELDDQNSKNSSDGSDTNVKSCSAVPRDTALALRESNQSRGAYLFDSCPFCGGYPDVLEKSFPDRDTLDAQGALRKHIKQHMQEIALFLPPYRSDIFDRDDDSKGSDVTHKRSSIQENPETTDDLSVTCDREECDCKHPGKPADDDNESSYHYVPTEINEGGLVHQWACCLCDNNYIDQKHVCTLCAHTRCSKCFEYDHVGLYDGDWPWLFNDRSFYNRSRVTVSEVINDERLAPFVMRYAVGGLRNPTALMEEHVTSIPDYLDAQSVVTAKGTIIIWVLLRIYARTQEQGHAVNEQTPLFIAAKNGQLRTVRQLLAQPEASGDLAMVFKKHHQNLLVIRGPNISACYVDKTEEDMELPPADDFLKDEVKVKHQEDALRQMAQHVDSGLVPTSQWESGKNDDDRVEYFNDTRSGTLEEVVAPQTAIFPKTFYGNYIGDTDAITDDSVSSSREGLGDVLKHQHTTPEHGSAVPGTTQEGHSIDRISHLSSLPLNNLHEDDKEDVYTRPSLKRRSNDSQEDEDTTKRPDSTKLPSSKVHDGSLVPKSILRRPTKKFPEDPDPIREGIAPHKDALKGRDVPVGARWTRIDRRLVNPEALEQAKERFEERMDCVIVLRVLTLEEVQELANQTKKIREQREDEAMADRTKESREQRDYEENSSYQVTSSPVAEDTQRTHDRIRGRGDSHTVEETQWDRNRRNTESPSSHERRRGSIDNADIFHSMYSYTDAASMYRDTEPARRRPRSQSQGYSRERGDAHVDKPQSSSRESEFHNRSLSPLAEQVRSERPNQNHPLKTPVSSPDRYTGRSRRNSADDSLHKDTVSNSSNPEEKRSGSYAVEASETPELIFMGRPWPDISSVYSATCTQIDIERVLTEIQICARTHPECGTPSDSSLPTRVLDVGTMSNPSLRLVEPLDELAIGRWACLSHVWGFKPLLSTTRANLNAFKVDIPWALLPKKFLDVVLFTRLLGIRWLWIDSLCIIQDDPEDRHKESTAMEYTYKNGYLTIVIDTASTAEDNADG
jgi:hypothetical protein